MTEIFSVFGQLEAVAADILVERGQARKIPYEQIPETAQFNKLGHKARFAVMMPAGLVPEYEKLIKELRA
jgi:hypothetical protein